MKKRVLTILMIVLLICNISCPILAQDIQNSVVQNEQNSQTNETTEIQKLQDKHTEIQEQINQSNDQLGNVQTGLSETMMQIQALDEKIEAYEKEIASLGKEKSELEVSIDELEKKLVVAEANYEEKKQNLETRLLVMYEAGEITYLDVLLNSKSISDFISRYYLISQIAEYDEKLMEEAEIEKMSIEVAKNTLEDQKNRYKAAKDNVEKTSIILANTRVVKTNYISKLTTEERELQEKIDYYNEQIKELEDEILMLSTANFGSDYIGGTFLWPVPGYTRVTSPYGMRVHPITQVYKLHTGTDVGAPEGTNFLAMNSGVVVKASMNGAYGNTVIVDHGGGVTTLYAHGSEILVEVGQYVTKGQPVLKVGSTGYSTGPHAHFEIRINGQYTDPMQFFKAQDEENKGENLQ